MASPDQSVAGNVDINVPAVDNSAAIRAEYEAQISALKKQAAEADERFQGIKGKLDEVYKNQNEKRLKTLEDQGQYKPLWEEANKTAQERQQQIGDLERQLQELKASNETAAMKTSALAAISQAGAINAEQMLQLVQGNLKKADDGRVVILDGGVEQDINVHLAKLKNPGSGFEHHFKPTSSAGMGAKPSTGTASAAGMANPYADATFNLTRQMTLEESDPQLAAVLKREAGK